MDKTIRLLIVDDHAIVREGLVAMLETKTGIQVIGEAADGVEAVEKALLLKPDVILMDLVMPRKNGISAIHDIIERQPAARILVLSSFNEDAQVVESMRAGALGYILKDAKMDELENAIHKVYARESPLNPLVARRLVANLTPPRDEPRLTEILTARELVIIPMVARGLTNREISQQLGISYRTVGTHVSHMIKKAGVDNRTQLSRLALQQGLTSLYTDE